ncbi:cupin domain-containing protein [Halalkalibacillus halophilus]|uniref:cupin domain-containing protein n=1 Tax=Halalkalibacillus halophilus TaxID=392827 RepID=UPI000482A804|nr:cupin domain-containing protein [Halalkalibacillus halophilus]
MYNRQNWCQCGHQQMNLGWHQPNMNMPAGYGAQMNTPYGQPNMPYEQWMQKGQGMKDHGGEPYVVNIEEVTKQNQNFRTALWTGEHLQVTLMSIEPGDDIGLEMHPDVDQFIRIEEGQGLVQMGDRQDRLDFNQYASDDFAIMVPAGKWHNLINTGHRPLKVYSIYAPPEHPFGTVHRTKAEALAAEKHHH